jgi:glutathione peroxidase
MKILIDKNGKVADTYASFTNPMSKKITSKIEQILN